MLSTSQLDYDLPADRIATRAAEPRDSARMLVVSRSDPSFVEHATVKDVPRFLAPGDLAVFNRSRVLRARIRGHRVDSGGVVEGLFLERAPESRSQWRMLLKSNGKLRPGLVIQLEAAHGGATAQRLELIDRDEATWIVQPEPSVDDPASLLEQIGLTPLPPYILSARRTKHESVSDDDDRRHYQTVYAEHAADSVGDGSVAAPTAGLHFTPALLEKLRRRGVQEAFVELDVGWGTFQPVQAANLEDHPMHRERCRISAEVVRLIRDGKSKGGARRIVSIGTTTARTLESIPDPLEQWTDTGWVGETDLLIAPGHSWRHVDVLLTNFHLPRSTLLAMVGALFPEGVERLLELYRIAIEREYRFYSYGDAMLILP